MPRLDIDARARAIAERCAARRASYETHGGGTNRKTTARTCRLSWRSLAARTGAENRRIRANIARAKAYREKIGKRARAKADREQAARLKAALRTVAAWDREDARALLASRTLLACEGEAHDHGFLNSRR